MTDALDHVDQLCAWLADTDIALLELTSPTRTLRLLHDDTRVTVETVDGPDGLCQPALVVRAAAPGRFLQQHPLRDRALAVVGEDVAADAPLGLLQIGPLLLAVSAPSTGIVTDVLALHGTIVGYGTPLFELQPLEDELKHEDLDLSAPRDRSVSSARLDAVHAGDPMGIPLPKEARNT
jgi:acetyl-CoA carboxylase biotin carboxyl carrier protein